MRVPAIAATNSNKMVEAEEDGARAEGVAHLVGEESVDDSVEKPNYLAKFS
jgi:hypothetical protein